jgi:hypothetical protein
MSVEWNEKVRQRAYAIWEQDERPEGSAEQHWTRAEEELRADQQAPAEAPPTSTAGSEFWTAADESCEETVTQR